MQKQLPACLSALSGNILLTTGVKTLHFYETHVKDFTVRSYVRILDTPESHQIAAASKANLLYAMPPFTEQDTLRSIYQYDIQILVSKDSGVKGGLPGKINAAGKAGIPVLLIQRPEETGMTLQEILLQLEDVSCQI